MHSGAFTQSKAGARCAPDKHHAITHEVNAACAQRAPRTQHNSCRPPADVHVVSETMCGATRATSGEHDCMPHAERLMEPQDGLSEHPMIGMHLWMNPDMALPGWQSYIRHFQSYIRHFQDDSPLKHKPIPSRLC